MNTQTKRKCSAKGKALELRYADLFPELGISHVAMHPILHPCGKRLHCICCPLRLQKHPTISQVFHKTSHLILFRHLQSRLTETNALDVARIKRSEMNDGYGHEKISARKSHKG